MKLHYKWMTTLAIGSALFLVGCGNNEQADRADSDTITVLRPDFSEYRPKSEDLWMWKEYEKMSGVNVEWEEMNDIGEKKNLILSRKTLPDVLYQTSWSNDEIVKFGQQGLFVPLEDMIEAHAPNLYALMEEYPVIRKAITSPDGHIYSLPYLCTDIMGGGRTLRLYINQTWLDNLGLEKPTTTEELKTVLKAFVTEDPNQNGEADEYGWYMNSGEYASGFEKIINTAYGLGTGGRTAMDNMLYLDENGEIQLTINSDKQREVWNYMGELYKEGLASKQAFSGVDVDKWVSDASKDVVGLWQWVGPEYIGTTVEDNYTPINIIEGPNGDKALAAQPPVMSTSSLIVTKDAPSPEKILEWVDYFYSEEGSEFGSLGRENVTYIVKDDKNVYVDEILNYQNGPQLGAFQYLDNVYGGNFPYLDLNQNAKQIAYGLEERTYDDVTEDDFDQEQLPNFMSTADEASELSTITTDMVNYIEQSRVKFITGEWDLNKDWDPYVEHLKTIGSDRMLEIRQEQYARYLD